MNNATLTRLGGAMRLLLLAALVLTLSLGTGQMARAATNPAPVNLGAATSFVILTKTGVTNVPNSAITGNLGVSPIDSTSITGLSLVADSTNVFSTSSQVTGKIYAANYAAPTPSNLTTAISNMEAAYADAAGRTLPDFTELHAGNLSGKTLVPGLYKWSSNVLITSDVTLAGAADSIWIFQIAGDLTVGSGAQVLLSGGANANNIFWQVGGGTGVEIGTTAHVEGTILAAKAIHLRTGSSLNGRALAQTAVTLDKNVVSISAPAFSSFGDVPLTHWASSYIERLYNAGVTDGCSINPLNYCPDSPVTRAEIAVFLLKGMHGPSYAPPVVGDNTGFNDVPVDYWAAAWIKQLAVEGVTYGCGAGSYCPDATVSRAQIAVLLLKAKNGAAYTPPSVGDSTGFSDVATNHWAAAYIKQLVADGITGGCGASLYCPDFNVTRAQMAVFLVKAFDLP